MWRWRCDDVDVTVDDVDATVDDVDATVDEVDVTVDDDRRCDSRCVINS